MRSTAFIVACALIVSAGCSSPSKKTSGAKPQGAPRSPVTPEVIERMDAADASSARPLAYASPSLPNQIIVPAQYRLMYQDGRPVFVRETDARRISAHPAVLLTSAEPGSGEVNLQPALLPQELAREIVANRAQTQALMEVVPKVEQSVEVLGQQAELLSRQNRQIMEIVPTREKVETKN